MFAKTGTFLKLYDKDEVKKFKEGDIISISILKFNHEDTKIKSGSGFGCECRISEIKENSMIIDASYRYFSIVKEIDYKDIININMIHEVDDDYTYC
jgi:hypothetical protein